MELGDTPVVPVELGDGPSVELGDTPVVSVGLGDVPVVGEVTAESVVMSTGVVVISGIVGTVGNGHSLTPKVPQSFTKFFPKSLSVRIKVDVDKLPNISLKSVLRQAE